MMKATKTLLLSLAVCLLVTPGCKKEKNESPIVGNWQIAKIETRTSGTNWSDLGEGCRLDDVEEYGAGGSWTFYDGVDQCEAGSGIIRGTWKLTSGNEKVVYTYDGYSGEYDKTVETLTESSMVLLHNAGDLANTQFRYTFTKK